MNIINRWFHNLNISKKITTVTLAIVFITLLTFILITAIFLYSQNIKALKQNTYSIADIMSKKIAPALIFNKKSEIDIQLQTLNELPSLSNVCIYSKQKLLLHQYSYENIECNETLNFNSKNKYKDNISIISDIYWDTQILGYINFNMSINSVKNQIRFFTLTGSFIFVLLILISLYLSIKLHKSISSPLLQLKDKALEIQTSNNYIIDIPSKIEHSEIVILYDALKKMISEIKHRENDLKNEISRKDDFIKYISHELKTPTCYMTNSLDIISSMWDIMDDTSKKEQLLIANKGAYRLGLLVKDLTSISLLNGGIGNSEKASDENNISDICSFAIECSNSVKKELNKERIKIKFEKKSKKETIKCDSTKISQVLINILDNAIKYSIDGTILVSIDDINYNGNEAIKICIKDQGIGIPRDEINTIFRPIYQSSRTKSSTEGKGLGLTICKKFIELHNGKIWAENNKNEKGTTFHIIVPERS